MKTRISSLHRVTRRWKWGTHAAERKLRSSTRSPGPMAEVICWLKTPRHVPLGGGDPTLCLDLGPHRGQPGCEPLNARKHLTCNQ